MKKQWKMKERTRELRRKGLSYSEIREHMPLAKSTISVWCKDIELTERQISRLNRRKEEGRYAGNLKASKLNKEKRAKEINQIKEIARAELSLFFEISGCLIFTISIDFVNFFIDFAINSE